MTQTQFLFLGLTAIVAGLTAVLVFAVLRFATAARSAAKDRRKEGSETVFMAAAMEDALQKLREQERAMKARAEASERLSGEIVASMTSGLLVVGHDSMVLTVNPAGRRLLNLDDHPATKSYRELLSDAPPLADVIGECLTKGDAIVRRSVQMNRAGGGITHLGVTVSPIRDEGGAAHGAICLFTDLSDVVELEEQLRLKDSLARLGELTAGIAHEFRNGLATIHGYSRLFDLNTLPADYRPYVQGIRDETEALGQVVTKFLSFAKPTELVVGPVDLRAIVERAVEEIAADARARGGEVSVRGDFGTVCGDEVLLRQAFSNLARNALEACDNARIAPRIAIAGERDEPHSVLRVTVTDNGPGVDPNVAGRMFRPFVTTKARGTGLGLAIVQKIVVTHNGRVAVTPSDGGGARFTVTLPLG